jgi:hypothetical protein
MVAVSAVRLLARESMGGAAFVARTTPSSHGALWAPIMLDCETGGGQAIGPDVRESLSQQTGLSRDEIVARLSRELPQAVDKYTPEGRLPTEDDFQRS